MSRLDYQMIKPAIEHTFDMINPPTLAQLSVDIDISIQPVVLKGGTTRSVCLP